MTKKLNIEDLLEGQQLRCIEDFFPCFHKNDICTVEHSLIRHEEYSGLILICRKKMWHAMEDFVCDFEGNIGGFERINN
jgi:hypothetical protein